MQAGFEKIGKMFTMAFVEGDRWKLYIEGLGVTLQIAFFAAILGLIIGTIVALMKLSTRRKIYYTSVITALVAILASAVVINRTLVNTPEFNIEEISPEAGEPVSAYMAYAEGDGDVVVGIAENGDEEVGTIIEFVRSIPLGEPLENNGTQALVADAWVALYDDQNRIASRLNFYDGGKIMWYDGERYQGSPEIMRQLIEYCDASADEPEESSSPEPSTTPNALEDKND